MKKPRIPWHTKLATLLAALGLVAAFASMHGTINGYRDGYFAAKKKYYIPPASYFKTE